MNQAGWSRLLAVLDRAGEDRRRIADFPEYGKQDQLSRIIREVLEKFSKVATCLAQDMELIPDAGGGRHRAPAPML